MNSLKIVFVTPEYVTEEYFSGGLANYIHRVAKSLVSMGHQVHVIILSDDSEEIAFKHQGIAVHRIAAGSLRSKLKRLTLGRLPQTIKWLDLSTQAYRKLKQINQSLSQVDIVQFPNYRACGLISTLLLKSIPQVTRVSSYRPMWNKTAGVDRTKDVVVLERLESLQMRLTKYIYGPSYALKKVLKKDAGIDIDVIRTPFYLETVEWDSSIYDNHLIEKDYLLFFGRFQMHKGFHILAQAVPQILEHHRNLHVVFVGLDRPSPLASSMKQYALSIAGNKSDRLIFFGQTSHAQLYPIIAGAKIVALPSLADNLPNACLEAMAIGKPVIGTIGTSLDELIEDEETGFLVSPNDVDALAKRVIQAWTHPSLDQIGQEAKKKLVDFSPACTVQELLSYYEGVLNERR